LDHEWGDVVIVIRVVHEGRDVVFVGVVVIFVVVAG
jgi:hypothetical protein